MKSAAKLLFAVAVPALACLIGCEHASEARSSESGSVAARSERQITGVSAYPVAVYPNRVGTYPADTKSGAGYFYDDVLEYRVCLHPENGAQPLNGMKDYFVAFAQYEPARAFSERSPGAEPPLVLVRQREWIDEPVRGRFIRKAGERITEWQVPWLKDAKRTEHSVDDFVKHPVEAK